MCRLRPIICLCVATTMFSCASATKSRNKKVAKGGPPPGWVTHIEVESDKLCGVGIAGAAFDKSSPYPKQMSEERAVRNLAGALETNIQEAIIDREVNSSHRIDTARVLTVDDALLEQVAQMAQTDFWLDEGGTGPFAQKNFTYAHTCIDAKVAASTFKVDLKALRGKGKRKPMSPKQTPKWIKHTGKQPGGRLCAVGFSLPTFHPDKTFDVVVEDVRSQLAMVLQTLVSSYYEELTTNRYQLFEMMTVATTQAVSKGAIVTAFWHDRDGIGPFHKKRTTYGWGCVYPVDVMKRSIDVVEKELPENVVQKVRERAQSAFDDLDAEIEKREPMVPAPSAAPELSEAPVPAPAPIVAQPNPAALTKSKDDEAEPVAPAAREALPPQSGS